MAATREDVDRWINMAKKDKNKFIISVCDTWDYEDYPVFCKDLDELYSSYPEYSGKNMQRVNEIIRINEDGSVDENLRMSAL